MPENREIKWVEIAGHKIDARKLVCEECQAMDLDVDVDTTDVAWKATCTQGHSWEFFPSYLAEPKGEPLNRYQVLYAVTVEAEDEDEDAAWAITDEAMMLKENTILGVELLEVRPDRGLGA